MELQTANAGAFGAAVDTHPRARGFKVLSRLARVEHVPGRRIAEPVTPEHGATVLTLERPAHTPRHRLDIATDFLVSLSS